jgi:Right handed beta helix region/Cohesin domain
MFTVDVIEQTGTSGSATFDVNIADATRITARSNPHGTPGSDIETIGATNAAATTATYSDSIFLDDNATLSSAVGGASLLFTGNAFDIKNHGLTIDGNNPALAADPRTIVYNGAPIDAFDGISCYAGVGSLTIDHNVVRNATYTGIDLENGSAAASSANSVSSNLIQNIGGAGAGFGSGIFLSNNFYAAVTNNVIETALIGIQTQDFSAANPGGPGTAQISGNTIAAVGSGIWYNDFSAAASPFLISDNTITAVEDAASLGRWVGVLISSQLASAGATFENNAIDGSATAANHSQTSYGIEASAGSAVVTDSLIENNGIGIYAHGGASVTVSSNGILGNTTGIEIADATLVSATNNIISGGQYGIRIDPTAASVGPIGGGSLAGNSIYGNVIAGLRNDSSLAINATGNWWSSADGPNSALNLYQPNNPTGDTILGDQVTFAPWLTSGTDTAPTTNGFQPTSLDSHAPVLSGQLDQAATEGSAQSVNLGSFSDADNSGGGAWHIIVNWGDNSAGDSFNAASGGNLGALVHTFAQEGHDTVTVTVIEQAGTAGLAAFDVNVAVAPSTFQVTSFNGSPSGFDATFDRPVDVSRLNLYSGASDELGPADVTLVGQHGNSPVLGSLIWDAATNTAHFVATGGVLAPDTYSVDLASRANGWTDSNGSPLDGLATGVAGSGDYTNTFVVAAPTAPVLSLPDFARGPGQSVNVNADGTARTPNLPVHLSDAGGLRSLSFEIDFDPSLLNLTGAVMASGLPADWSVTAQRTNSGGAAQLVVSAFGATALGAGPSDIVDLVGDIPSGASYRAAQVLKPINVELNSGAIGVVVDEAVEKVAYFGDATGDSTLSGLDASFISRNVVSLDDGFSAYPLTDPRIIADVTGDGTLSGLDASFAARAVVGNLPATIPAVPSHATPAMNGLDPTVSIPLGVAAVAGGTVTLPVAVSEANGLQAIDLVLAYDPSALSISPADVSLSGFAAAGGWTQALSLATPGEIRLSLYGTNPIAASGAGPLVNITFHVSPTAAGGEYPINVVTAPSTASRLNEGLLSLSTSNGSIVVESSFEVVNTNDDGPGSLRQAIESANGLGDAASTIRFALPAGPRTISLLTPLPATAAPVVMQLGATQDVTILGNIDGAGSLVVNGGNKLTVNHIVQNALVIGGTEGSVGTVTIAASDAAGNPLVSAAPAVPPQATAATADALSTSTTPTVTATRAGAVIHKTVAATPLVRPIIPNGFEPHFMSTIVASSPDELAYKMAHDAAFVQTNFASAIDDALVDLLTGSIHRRHRGASPPTPAIDEVIAEWRVLRG